MKITRKDFFSDNLTARFISDHVTPIIFKTAPAANLIVIFTATLLTSIFYYSGSRVIPYWLVAMLSLTGIRLVIVFLSKHNDYKYNGIKALNIYTITTLLLGITWGSIVFIIPTTNNEVITSAIVYLALGTVFTAAIPILSIHLKAYFLYTMPVLLGGIYHAFTTPTLLNLTATLALTCIALFSIVVTIKMNKTTIKNIESSETTKALISNLKSEVKNRERAQIELVEYKSLLEERVKNRTEQLLIMNSKLDMEVNKRKHIEQSMHHIAHNDPLTNLPNKLFFNACLERAQTRALHDRQLIALLLIDIDDFNTTNKDYGYEAGNKVLKAVGEQLSGLLKDATVARYNNDQFIVLLDRMVNPDAVSYLCKQISLLVKYVKAGRHIISLSFSIGASISSNDSRENDNLLTHAERALQKSKSTGGDRYSIYDATDEDMNYAINYIDELNIALDKQQLYMVFQPIISLKNHTIVSFEALLRWRHAAFGDVSPEKMLAIAYENNIIHKIDEYVFHEACMQMANWQRRGLNIKKIVINFSGCAQSLEYLVTNMQRLLDETGCKGKWIEMEITEEFIVQASDESFRHILLLKEMGLSFTVDDFGSAYTSFFRFQQLPINAIKVSQILLGQLLDSDVTGLDKMLKAIQAVGESFSLKLIVKGIENHIQERSFIKYNYDFAQGNLYSKPLNVHEVPRYIKHFPEYSKNHLHLRAQVNA